VEEQTAVAAVREARNLPAWGLRPVKFDHAVMWRKHRSKETQYDEPASTATVCLLAAAVPEWVLSCVKFFSHSLGQKQAFAVDRRRHLSRAISQTALMHAELKTSWVLDLLSGERGAPRDLARRPQL